LRSQSARCPSPANTTPLASTSPVRRITLRLETNLAHVVLDGVLAAPFRSPWPPNAPTSKALGLPPAPLPDKRPAQVQCTVSCCGGTQIIGQRIQVGLRYAGQSVTIEVDATTLRVYDQRNQLIKTVSRTSRKEVHRHKTYGQTTNHQTG
jgi:hypothetical protein